MRAVSRAVTLQGSADEIWALIAEPDGLSRWLEVDFDVDVRPAAMGVARTARGNRRVLVEAVVPGERVSFLWWPLQGASLSEPPSMVEISLTETDGRTTVTVSETVLADAEAGQR